MMMKPPNLFLLLSLSFEGAEPVVVVLCSLWFSKRQEGEKVQPRCSQAGAGQGRAQAELNPR